MTTDLDDLVFESPPWLKTEAEESDVVLSSRVRLARNLGNIPFPNHAQEETLEEVLTQVKRVLPKMESFPGAVFFEMAALSNSEQHILAERRLISPEFIMKKIPAGLVLDDNRLLSLMINEEDHLRLQVLNPGLSLDKLLEKAEELDRELSTSLEFAYSEEFGYLTACPTNAGTGLRVSLFVHLPALAEANRLQDVLGTKPPSGLAVRGFYGEGSEVVGQIYQISNQLTLGWTEWRILEDLSDTAHKIIREERAAREKLVEEENIHLEDRVFRALGILQKARLVSSLEFIEHFSSLRLGVLTGLLPEIDLQVVNDLLVLTQPAHIQRIAGRPMSPLDRDVFRADLIRSRLHI
jgi:protein arginine kinase